MAQEVIGAKVEVDASSVGNLRKQLKEATAELIRMQDQFGATSKEAMDAAKRVANLKDIIQEAREVADLFDPGNKFKVFGNAVGAVTNGFTALQGAMGLFGVESKEVEQQLLRVQSAMALSQGLSAIMDSGKEFQRLGAIIKTQVVTAFQTLRGAIMATGIGALVVALGTIAANWENIMRLVNGVSKEQEKLNADTANNTKEQQKILTQLDQNDAKLKAQGKSEREILDMKVKQSKEIMNAIQLQIKNAEITKKAQDAAAQRNFELTKNLVRFGTESATAILRVLAAPLDLLIITANQVSKVLGFGEITAFRVNDQISKMNDAVSSWVGVQIFDVEGTAKKGQEVIDGLKSDFQKAENQYYTYQNNIAAIDKQAAEQAKARRDKLAEDERKAREARLAERKKEEDKVYEILTQATAKRVALDEKEKADFFNRVQNSGNQTIARLQKQVTDQQTILEDDLRRKEELRNTEIQLYADVGNAMGALSDLIGRETAAGKALAIAQATINTWLGVTQVLRQKSVLPEPAATISKIINAATIVASGLNAVRNIVKTRVPGGGGSSGGGGTAAGSANTAAPMTPAVSPQAQLQLQNQQAINNLGNQSMRAYVLNSDIQNNEQRNAYLQRNSRIG